MKGKAKKPERCCKTDAIVQMASVFGEWKVCFILALALGDRMKEFFIVWRIMWMEVFIMKS